jgi:hypothetical protein
VAEGSDLDPLQQVIPHPWRTDNGKTQLRALGVQTGELLKVLSVPLLEHLPSALSIDCHIKQAMEFLLGHLLSPMHLHKLTLEEGDVSNKAFYIYTSRG